MVWMLAPKSNWAPAAVKKPPRMPASSPSLTAGIALKISNLASVPVASASPLASVAARSTGERAVWSKVNPKRMARPFNSEMDWAD